MKKSARKSKEEKLKELFRSDREPPPPMPPYERAWDMCYMGADDSLWQKPSDLEYGRYPFVVFRNVVGITRFLLYRQATGYYAMIWVRRYGVALGPKREDQPVEPFDTLEAAKARVATLTAAGEVARLTLIENNQIEGLCGQPGIVTKFETGFETAAPSVKLNWRRMDGARFQIDAQHAHGFYVLESQMVDWDKPC